MTTGLRAGIPLEDGELSTGRKDRRRRSPLDLVDRHDQVMLFLGQTTRGASGDTEQRGHERNHDAREIFISSS